MNPCRRHIILYGLLLPFSLHGLSVVHAENAQNSPNIYGAIGLNTIPSARMDDVGRIRAGLSTLDPYAHAWISLQLAPPLSITLRQSAETSSLSKDAKRLYPATDIKLRIAKETRARPEIALGLQAAIGHKRMAGEYLALSKRYKNFDFTGGLGWGRYGTAAHFSNPLKNISGHFGGSRTLDGEQPNTPEHWFTGETIGLFAGLEYITPFDGLSLKLDYGADRYTAEQAAFGYNTPAPWSVGLNYAPMPWVDLGLAVQGTGKLMARLSFQNHINDIYGKRSRIKPKSPIFRPYRTDLTRPQHMELSAQKDNQSLFGTHADRHIMHSQLDLNEAYSTPLQIGHAATTMANHAGRDIEKLSITPRILGLKGPKIEIMRRDLEMARGKQQGSAEEIWHNASFTPSTGIAWPRPQRAPQKPQGPQDLHFTLDNQLSLSEENSGALYRTSLTAGWRGKTSFFGLLTAGTSLRLNIKDNLKNIADIRPKALLPVRSNEDRFAARTLGLDTQYLAFTHSFRSDLHLSLIGGYLEEMYSGLGGEILYRPAHARWAIGAESWLALKRNPETALNLGLNGDHLITGHLNGWYDVESLDLTLHGKIGRYLAEDLGGSIALQKQFHNGAKLEGFITLTNQADFDLYGGTTHAYNGVRLSLPLGNFKHMPANSTLNIKAAPFGRDTGQALKNPLPLYELTEGFSMRHLSEYWGEIVE